MTSSLRHVALKTVTNCTTAAEQLVRAYRSGSLRLIDRLRQGVDRAAHQGASRLSPRLAWSLQQAGARVGDAAQQGVQAISSGSTRVIALSARQVKAQVHRVAQLSDQVDNRWVVNGLQTTARLGLPGARVALRLSEQMAAAAGRLPQTAPAGRATKPGKATKATRAVQSAVAKAPRTTKGTMAKQATAKTAVAPKTARAAKSRKAGTTARASTRSATAPARSTQAA